MVVQIKKCGDYLCLNSRGEIVPLASRNKIKEKWNPFIQDYINFYKKELGDKLVSVYVRGSIAKGSDEDGIADFDGIIISNESVSLCKSSYENFESYLKETYPFCRDIEANICSINDMDFEKVTKPGNIWPKFLKTQSVCLYGEDLSQRIKPFKLSEMLHYSKYIICSIEDKWVQYIEEDKNDSEELRNTCNWGCRLLLRAGFELVMNRENKWTNDLFRCFEGLVKYYPLKEEMFYKTLDYALNPVDDAAELIRLKEQWTPWLYEEVKIQLGINGDIEY